MSARYTLGSYVSCLTLLPFLLMVILVEVVLLHDRTTNMEQNQLARGQLLARQLVSGAEYGLFSSNRHLLHELAVQALHEPDVLTVRITNRDGVLLAVAGDMEITLPRMEVEAIRDDGKMLMLFQPVYPTSLLLDEPGRQTLTEPIGMIALVLDWERTYKAQRQLFWEVGLTTLALLLLAAYLVYRASLRLTNPIHHLNSAIHAIGRGELFTRVRHEVCIRELQSLTDGVNEMAAQLQQERALLQHRIDEATEQLRMMAFYDTLTGLPNRRLLSDRLHQVVEASKRSGRHAAIMFLDMDNFKPLNDNYGHSVGDLLLIEAGSRIESCLRGIDTVARFGGDEFVVLLNELDTDRNISAHQARIVAEKIRATLSVPYQLRYQAEGQPPTSVQHICTASIGMVLFQGQHADQEQILAQADAAMYQAKASRDAIRFLDEAVDCRQSELGKDETEADFHLIGYSAGIAPDA